MHLHLFNNYHFFQVVSLNLCKISNSLSLPCEEFILFLIFLFSLCGEVTVTRIIHTFCYVISPLKIKLITISDNHLRFVRFSKD